jgi:CRP/FNR family transcriptional regulator, cyclic AMP receptor protein
MPQHIDAVALFAGAHARMSSDDDGFVVTGWQLADWEHLFARMTPRSIAAGSVVIQKDAPERTLYFVVSGLLEVTMVLSSHSIARIAKIKPGSVVGELAFLDGRPRSAKVWAVVDSALYGLEYDDYCKFADANPTLACDLVFGIGRLVATRFRRAYISTMR